MTPDEADFKGWRTECCTCKANMHVKYDYDDPALRSRLKTVLKSSTFSRGSYSPLLFHISPLLPLREETLEHIQMEIVRSKALLPGSTKLKKSNKHPNLFLKCEFQNPTGSFKDVGTICEFAKASEMDLGGRSDHSQSSTQHAGNNHSLHLASTGNMGVSAAYYASALRIPLVLHISKYVNREKLERMRAFGLDSTSGSVRSCLKCASGDGGAYDEQQDHVREEFEKANLGTRMWIGDTSLRIEGCKTIGYEIFSQLGGRVPDNVIVPVGNGTLLCGIWKAFDELERMEITSKIPRMYGVVVSEKLHSQVSALGVNKPGDLTSAFKIIRDTNGAFLSTDAVAIYEGQKRLFIEEDGIDAEPAGAITYASYRHLVNESRQAGEVTVALISGGKLKVRSEEPKEEFRLSISP
jgi:threonine synthase